MKFRQPERLEKWIAYDGALGADLLVAETQADAPEDAGHGGGADVFEAEFGVFAAGRIGLDLGGIDGDNNIHKDGVSVDGNDAEFSVSMLDNADADALLPYLNDDSDIFTSAVKGRSDGVAADDIYFELTNPDGGEFDFLMRDVVLGNPGYYGDIIGQGKSIMLLAENGGDGRYLLTEYRYNGHQFQEVNNGARAEVAFTDNGMRFHITRNGSNDGNAGLNTLFRSLTFNNNDGVYPDTITGFEITARYKEDIGDASNNDNSSDYFNDNNPDGMYNPDNEDVIVGSSDDEGGGDEGGGDEGGGDEGGGDEGGGDEGGGDEGGGDEGGGDEGGGDEGGGDEGGGDEGGGDEGGGDEGGGDEGGGDEGGGDEGPGDIAPPVVPSTPGGSESGGDDGGGEDGGGDDSGGDADSGGDGDSGADAGQGDGDMGVVFQEEEDGSGEDGSENADADAREDAAPTAEARAGEERASESAAEAQHLELARDMEFMLTAVRNERAVLLGLIGRLQSEYLSREPMEYGELRGYLRRLFDMGGREQETVNRIIDAMNREMEVFRATAPGQRDGMLAESVRELIDSAERHSGEMGAYSQAIEAVADLLAGRRAEGLPPPTEAEAEALFAAKYEEALSGWLANAERIDPMGRELTAAQRVGGMTQE